MDYVFLKDYKVDSKTNTLSGTFPMDRGRKIFYSQSDQDVLSSTIIIETITQHCIALLREINSNSKSVIPILLGIDRIDFHKEVEMDWILNIFIKKEFSAGNLFKFSAQVMSGENLCATAVLNVALQKAPEGAGIELSRFNFSNSFAWEVIMNKLKKWTLRILVFLTTSAIILLIVVWFTNIYLFSRCRPEVNEGERLWEGKFKSSYYNRFVSGRMFVVLPDPLPDLSLSDEVTFQSRVNMYFNLWTIFPGMRVNLSGEGKAQLEDFVLNTTLNLGIDSEAKNMLLIKGRTPGSKKLKSPDDVREIEGEYQVNEARQWLKFYFKNSKPPESVDLVGRLDQGNYSIKPEKL